MLSVRSVGQLQVWDRNQTTWSTYGNRMKDSTKLQHIPSSSPSHVLSSSYSLAGKRGGFRINASPKWPFPSCTIPFNTLCRLARTSCSCMDNYSMLLSTWAESCVAVDRSMMWWINEFCWRSNRIETQRKRKQDQHKDSNVRYEAAGDSPAETPTLLPVALNSLESHVLICVRVKKKKKRSLGISCLLCCLHKHIVAILGKIKAHCHVTWKFHVFTQSFSCYNVIVSWFTWSFVRII